MAEIVCDDPVIGEILADLRRVVEANGAQLSAGVRFICADGYMVIETASSVPVGGPVAYMPGTCLPRIEDFRITHAGDTLRATPRNKKVPSVQRRIMSLMLALFYSAGKLDWLADHSPTIAFNDDRKLLETLAEARTNRSHWLDLVGKPRSQRLISGFLLGRRFQFPGEKHRVLIPFIDFADHHAQATPYGMQDAKELTARYIGLLNAKPVAASAQCYVKYGTFDRFDSAIDYCFVDESAPFAQSVPLELDLPEGGRLLVGSLKVDQFKMESGQVPAEFQLTQAFVPQFVINDDRSMEVAYLLIPGELATRTTRRVIEVLLNTYQRRFNMTMDTSAYAERIEAEVIEANLGYYARLTQCLEASAVDRQRPAWRTLRRMAERQTDFIDAQRSVVGRV